MTDFDTARTVNAEDSEELLLDRAEAVSTPAETFADRRNCKTRESYDQVPYRADAIPFSHPDNLAVRSILAGLCPAKVERCRVLELGCADGGNLFPMAERFPDAEFVGIDISPRQINIGRQAMKTLGLENVELLEMDLAEFDTSLGEFDYIIVHGVFSWVPQPVQEMIFSICRNQLAPHGVAMISYNTLPGWHLPQGLRDAIRFRTRNLADPHECREVALQFIADLAQSTSDQAYALCLRNALASLEKASPAYFIHEYLEDNNLPMYFHEFERRAASHQLQYVCEANASLTEAPHGVTDTLVDLLNQSREKRVKWEQYLDFIENRRFRCSVLCRSEVELDYDFEPARFKGLHASALLTHVPTSEDAIGDGGSVFRAEDGSPFETKDAMTAIVLRELSTSFPGSMEFQELLSRVAKGVGGGVCRDDVAASVSKVVGKCFLHGFLRLRTLPSPCSTTIPVHPKVTTCARLQSANGLVVNAFHTSVDTRQNPLAKFLLEHADGDRDLDMLTSLAATLRLDSVKHKDGSEVRRLVAETVEGFHRCALFCS